MRQPNSESQTATYEVLPRDAARALDIQVFEDSAVAATVKNGKIVFTVKTDRWSGHEHHHEHKDERENYDG